MKLYIIHHPESSASAQAVHKAIQKRNHGRKSDNRYERSIVRAFLRHAQADVDDTLGFAV